MPSPDPDDAPVALPPELLTAVTAALGTTGAARAEALADLVASNAAHAAALRQLIADFEATERLLDSGFTHRAELPATLGPFRVLRRLGEGAFGEVFLCLQTEPVHREVAVKALRPGVGDRTTLDRFANERQLIASLQHPTIAQFLDAGTLADGRPYFVMDPIKGTPISRYCDEKALAVLARVDLFLDLCRGVQHAHDRGIVHRDLKPANVLVVEHAGRPLPKIIDFGIAKVLQGTAGKRALDTEAGRVVGTPGYMSPEQGKGLPDEVDARSDVFCLGVMLYELLCGQLPWAVATNTPDTDPQRPSSRLSSDRSTGSTIADLRSTAPRRLKSALRGDLDWIVLKCLRRERGSRYQTAQALIDDLERHRRSEPVLAGPPSATYRLRKFVRRHRTGLLLASGISCAAIVGTWVSVRFRDDAATSESRRLDDLLDAATRLYARAQDPRLFDAPRSDELRQELMQDALGLHDRLMQGQATGTQQRTQRLRTLISLADVHYGLGQYAQGEQVSAEAVAEARTLCATDPGDVTQRARLARSLRNLGRCILLRDEPARAAPVCADAIVELDRLRASDPSAQSNLLAKTLVEYAAAANRIGDPSTQLAAQQRAIAVLEEHLKQHPDDEETQRDLVRFHSGLSNIYRRRDDLDAACRALERAQHLAATQPKVTDEERAQVDYRLGTIREAQGLTGDAIAAYTTSVALHEALLQRNPGRHQLRTNLVATQTSLCRLRCQQGAHERALDHARAAIAAAEAFAPGSEARQGQFIDALLRVCAPLAATNLRATAEPAEAWLRRAVELALALPPGEPRATELQLRSRIQLARVMPLLNLDVPVATWERNLELANAVEDLECEYECHEGLSEALRKEGDFDGARTALHEARELARHFTPEQGSRLHTAQLGRTAWLVEFTAGDRAAVAAIAESLVGEGAKWESLHHAADGYLAALHLAEQDRAVGLASTYQHRCAELYERLIAATAGAGPEDDAGSLRALSNGQAKLRLAAFLAPGDSRAAKLRTEGLDRIDGLRNRVSSSWWHEGLWVESSMAQVRDQLRLADVAAAVRRLLTLTAALQTCDDLLLLTSLWAECSLAAALDPAAAKAAQEAAIDTLARAVDHGASRQGILLLPGLAVLQEHPRCRELLAKLPQ